VTVEYHKGLDGDSLLDALLEAVALVRAEAGQGADQAAA
jgi:hypothetical protein